MADRWNTSGQMPRNSELPPTTNTRTTQQSLPAEATFQNRDSDCAPDMSLSEIENQEAELNYKKSQLEDVLEKLKNIKERISQKYKLDPTPSAGDYENQLLMAMKNEQRSYAELFNISIQLSNLARKKKQGTSENCFLKCTGSNSVQNKQPQKRQRKSYFFQCDAVEDESQQASTHLPSENTRYSMKTSKNNPTIKYFDFTTTSGDKKDEEKVDRKSAFLRLLNPANNIEGASQGYSKANSQKIDGESSLPKHNPLTVIPAPPGTTGHKQSMGSMFFGNQDQSEEALIKPTTRVKPNSYVPMETTSNSASVTRQVKGLVKRSQHDSAIKPERKRLEVCLGSDNKLAMKRNNKKKEFDFSEDSLDSDDNSCLIKTNARARTLKKVQVFSSKRGSVVFPVYNEEVVFNPADASLRDRLHSFKGEMDCDSTESDVNRSKEIGINLLRSAVEARETSRKGPQMFFGGYR